MSLILQSSGGGQITIQEPATASNFTQTLPAASGEVMVSGNQPAFRAYSNTTQTFTTAVSTKIGINTVDFDTNSNFITATNRFQPTVAGYYQINSCAYFSTTVNITSWFLFIYKNGAVNSYGNGAQVTVINAFATAADIIYLNGSTDYIELYGYITGTGTLSCNAGTTFTYFSGSLVRAA
jgi:hypothetical protein